MEHKQATILVIDDDRLTSRVISDQLVRDGYTVYVAPDGQEGLRQMYAHRPDLIILDLMMPKMDGWTTCRRIREVSNVPIIMLTARDRPQDIIRGLDEGADEYVTKPFEVDVLVARVRAVLRRVALPPTSPPREEVAYSDDYLTFNPTDRRVMVNGDLVKLTPTEFSLLALLIKNSGRVLTYRRLLEQVWGWEYIDDVDYLRVYIWHLRRKLEPDPKNPRYVLTEHGVGYRFEGSAQR
ncbi:MAG: response regulator transcription factor [Anaerolineales bacterium]|nr:MAG: response regulator transcription factor [Anaerolineales bacterium]